MAAARASRTSSDPSSSRARCSRADVSRDRSDVSRVDRSARPRTRARVGASAVPPETSWVERSCGSGAAAWRTSWARHPSSRGTGPTTQPGAGPSTSTGGTHIGGDAERATASDVRRTCSASRADTRTARPSPRRTVRTCPRLSRRSTASSAAGGSVPSVERPAVASVVSQWQSAGGSSRRKACHRPSSERETRGPRRSHAPSTCVIEPSNTPSSTRCSATPTTPPDRANTSLSSLALTAPPSLSRSVDSREEGARLGASTTTGAPLTTRGAALPARSVRYAAATTRPRRSRWRRTATDWASRWSASSTSNAAGPLLGSRRRTASTAARNGLGPASVADSSRPLMSSAPNGWSRSGSLPSTRRWGTRRDVESSPRRSRSVVRPLSRRPRISMLRPSSSAVVMLCCCRPATSTSQSPCLL